MMILKLSMYDYEMNKNFRITFFGIILWILLIVDTYIAFKRVYTSRRVYRAESIHAYPKRAADLQQGQSNIF